MAMARRDPLEFRKRVPRSPLPAKDRLEEVDEVRGDSWEDA